MAELIVTGKTELPNNSRRPLDEDAPNGYLESDKDYVSNNLDLAVVLLDAYYSQTHS
jgi:hypothetical protein